MTGKLVLHSQLGCHPFSSTQWHSQGECTALNSARCLNTPCKLPQILTLEAFQVARVTQWHLLYIALGAQEVSEEEGGNVGHTEAPYKLTTVPPAGKPLNLPCLYFNLPSSSP